MWPRWRARSLARLIYTPRLWRLLTVVANHGAGSQVNLRPSWRRGSSLRMKNLFEAATVEEVKGRMAQLRPDSQRQWGKMNPAQALAHCSAAMEMAVGEKFPPRILIGLLLGRLAKKSMIVNEKPMPRNSGTDKSLVVNDARDFVAERQRLHEFIDRFAAGGPGACTKHPHFFFGPLTPQEWAALMYQHVDHPPRQFQV